MCDQYIESKKTAFTEITECVRFNLKKIHRKLVDSKFSVRFNLHVNIGPSVNGSSKLLLALELMHFHRQYDEVLN